MTEITPPLKPEKEINREAFKKTYEKPYEIFAISNLAPDLEILGSKGLIPEVVAFDMDLQALNIYMERVNGFELANFPAEHENYKFSVDLAQKAAKLLQGFFDAGYYHSDVHSDNIMYDQVKGRCVAVDLDSIQPNKNHEIPLKRYVQDYAVLMSQIFLGGSPQKAAIDMFKKGELQDFLGEEWDEFKEELNKLSDIDSLGGDIRLERNVRKLIPIMMEVKGLNSKINPAVREFMIRGLNPAACPENFDAILNLSV